MKLAIIDKIGLAYDGNTLEKQGLGGSESAVILIAKELTKLGISVTVFNNCLDSSASSEGVYAGVRYVDNRNAKNIREEFDIVVVSRTVDPFLTGDKYPFLLKAKERILWLHDTFIEGDPIMEDLVVSGVITHVFTLSDWHTSYILTADHGKKRNYEVLKKSIFQTRNGAVCHIPEVDIAAKDKNHFIYNASATKGMIPLLEHIWPEIKKHIPEAHLTVVGGYYRFREGAEPDEQERTVRELMSSDRLQALGVSFTGVIPQHEIAALLADAYMMLYPGAFPETFGISTLESLLYRTPLVTTRFGALEETAIEEACYLIDYAIEPNSLFPHVNKEQQIQLFLQTFFAAYNDPYMHQQKQYACDVVKDIAGWDTIALQWKQFFYQKLGLFLPVSEYREVSRINEKVSRVFNRITRTEQKEWRSFGEQQRILIVSPVWNAEDYIENHIRSVAAQDYDNYLHVIVDDVSTDDTVKRALEVITELGLQNTVEIIRNDKKCGAVQNQMIAIKQHILRGDDIVALLDGDDWLVNNPTIFHHLNDLYQHGIEFSYGSMWSLADRIPLIAQDYPAEVKRKKKYREHKFTWKIPYTHLRTTRAKYFDNINRDKLKDANGNWMMSGADNPLFYMLIEQIEPDAIYAEKEILVNYNDLNPNNDYKINGTEQNENADRSYSASDLPAPGVKKEEPTVKTILIAIPTNKNIEADTYKSLWDMEIPDGYKVHFEHFHGYQVDQIRNLIAEWGKRYDYLFCVDSDIVVPKNALKNFLGAHKDVISGMYIQRIPNTHTLEIYGDTPGGGCSNIPYTQLKDKGVVEIAACGFGCVLIDSKVLRKMEYPHFYYKSALNHADTVSEDVYFCMKARENGFKIWADTSIKCDHVGQRVFRVDDENLTRYRELCDRPMLPAPHVAYLENLSKEIQPKVIYDIGSSVLHWARPARDIWPDAKFFLFEAIEDVGPLYHEHGFHDFFLGVMSDIPGKHVLFYSDPMNFGGNSYYRETTGFFDGKQVQRVTNSIDNLGMLYRLPNPDLVKMDIQGAELDVLKGAVNMFKNTSDFIIEAQFADYNEGAPKAPQVIDYMDKAGYDLVSNFTKTNVDGDFHFSKRK